VQKRAICDTFLLIRQSLGILILLIGRAGTTWITSLSEMFPCRVVTGRTRFCTLQGMRHLHAPILSSSGIRDERNEIDRKEIKIYRLFIMIKYTWRFHAYFLLSFSFFLNCIIWLEQHENSSFIYSCIKKHIHLLFIYICNDATCSFMKYHYIRNSHNPNVILKMYSSD